ncbi:MAG TPA: hypothetical protein VK110_03420 [Salinisphaeraceae bacterium]|nr:hypothetical protein [Salinisphaeraceae bacterium]
MEITTRSAEVRPDYAWTSWAGQQRADRLLFLGQHWMPERAQWPVACLQVDDIWVKKPGWASRKKMLAGPAGAVCCDHG